MEQAPGWTYALAGCFGCFGYVPLLLAAAAIVDALRSGADWYWIPIILFFPVVGPVAYFVVVRGPWSDRRLVTMSPVAARRKQARRRLAEIEVQLTNWRGPVILAEAGEELFVLGKTKKAEEYLREARDNGGPVEEVNFRYAQLLAAGGRFAEAVPLLEELLEVDPDARIGEARLHLARCLDEAGHTDRAEEELRRVLERRQPIEAKVRLARILLAKGRGEEAAELLREARADADAMPRYLKRQHRAWIRAARQLTSPRKKLPRYRGPLPGGGRLRLVLGILALALLALLLLVGLFSRSYYEQAADAVISSHRVGEQALSEMARLRELHPWTRGDDLGAVDLSAVEVERYVRIRRALEDATETIARQRRAVETEIPALAAPQRRLSRQGAQNLQEVIVGISTYYRAVAAALAAAEMGPGELENLITLVEWRFFRRPEALLFALPSDDRGYWMKATSDLARMTYLLTETEVAASLREDYERQQSEARSRRRALERPAREATALSEATRELLESERGELEALRAEDLRYLVHALDFELAWISQQEFEWAARGME